MDRLWMWTFNDPNDGPAAVQIGEQTFTCDGYEVVMTPPDMPSGLDTRAIPSKPYKAVKVTFTLRLDTPDPVFITETVPTSQRIP